MQNILLSCQFCKIFHSYRLQVPLRTQPRCFFIRKTACCCQLSVGSDISGLIRNVYFSRSHFISEELVFLGWHGQNPILISRFLQKRKPLIVAVKTGIRHFLVAHSSYLQCRCRNLLLLPQLPLLLNLQWDADLFFLLNCWLRMSKNHYYVF